MLKPLTIFAAVCASLFFAGCGEKTAAQKEDEKRLEIREAKKQLAAKNYKLLAEKFPNHIHAGEAHQKAAELSAKK